MEQKSMDIDGLPTDSCLQDAFGECAGEHPFALMSLPSELLPLIMKAFFRSSVQSPLAALLVCKPLHAAAVVALACPEHLSHVVARRMRARLGRAVLAGDLYDTTLEPLRQRLVPADLPIPQRGERLLGLAASIHRDVAAMGGIADPDTHLQNLCLRAAAKRDWPSAQSLAQRCPDGVLEVCRHDMFLKAAGGGNVVLLRLLLHRGVIVADVDEPNGALQHAVCGGHLGAARFLVLEAGVSAQRLLPDAMRRACQAGHTEVIAQLLDWRVPACRLCLIGAAQEGRVETLQLLLQRGGPEVTEQSSRNAALLAAVRSAQREAAEALIAAGAVQTPHMADSVRGGAGVRLMLELGLEVAPSCASWALVRSVSSGDHDMLRGLLAAGAARVPGVCLRQALWAAVKFSTATALDAVRMLLEQGGWTAEDLASFVGSARLTPSVPAETVALLRGGMDRLAPAS